MRYSTSRPAKERQQRDRGVVALEFVLIVPLLLALVMTIVQFGLFFNKKVDVTSSARQAARTLALGATPTYPTGMTASGVYLCTAADRAAGSKNATVTLSASYTFSIPFVPLGTKTASATASFRCGG